MRSVPVERVAAATIVVHGCWAARRAHRSPTLAGRPLGIRWPLGANSETVLWGSAVAPPLTLAGAFAVAAVKGRRDWLALLGTVLVLGQLSEPLVYRRSSPPGEGWTRASVAVNLAAGSLLSQRRWRRRSGVAAT